MQRLFSSFPDGRPGWGLLVLRVAVSIAMIAQARACLNVPAGATWQMAAVGTIALLAAALLLAGFMTPLASAVAVAISLLGVMPSMTYVFAIALAIVLLGPGAFSVDARLFGRRVIVIAEP